MLLLFLPLLLAAQEKETPHLIPVWLSGGAYIDNDVTSIHLSCAVEVGKTTLSAGVGSRGGLLTKVANDGYGFQVVNLSVGRRWHTAWTHASVLIGPSLLTGDQRHDAGTFTYTRVQTVGLDLQSLFLFHIDNEVGLGIGIYGNLNPVHSFVGVRLHAMLGDGE